MLATQVAVILMTSTALLGQGCYDIKLEEGKKEYNLGKYAQAISIWKEAKECKRPPADIKTLDSWIWKATDTDGDELVNGKDKCPSVYAKTPTGCLTPVLSLIGKNMIQIQGGSFIMGCKISRDEECTNDDMTEHQVTLSSFYLSKYEVTVKQFKAFIDASEYQTDADKIGYSYISTGTSIIQKKGVNWSYNTAGIPLKEADYEQPVIHVSHNDAVAYCKWLSKQTGKTYRLPTEAEWEYAARGGRLLNKYKYAGSPNLLDVAWYNSNSGGTTHQVGTRMPNDLGLFDMSGNVWEWCSDTFSPNYYEHDLNNNPQGPTYDFNKVLRGGSWAEEARLCRIVTRNAHPQNFSDPSFGFRIARDL